MVISKSKISLYASLHTKKMRVKNQLFLVEGEKCVFDTLGAFTLETLIVTPSWLERHKDFVVGYGDRNLTADPTVMKKISCLTTPTDVIAVFRMPQDNGENILLPKDSLSLLLDGIQDPGNLGTIIRTADWFGFDTIYASNDTVDVFNPKTIQSTMGSLKRVKVKYLDLPALIKRSGIENVYGTLLDGKNMFKTSLDKRGVIVMGNEGNGISEEIRKLVNRPLLIPPYNESSHAESLNVGIATAITLSWFRFGK